MVCKLSSLESPSTFFGSTPCNPYPEPNLRHAPRLYWECLPKRIFTRNVENQKSAQHYRLTSPNRSTNLLLSSRLTSSHLTPKNNLLRNQTHISRPPNQRTTKTRSRSILPQTKTRASRESGLAVIALR